MAKVNPYTLKRPPRRMETKSFTDPDQPGEELTLALQSLDVIGATKANDVATGLIERWDGQPFILNEDQVIEELPESLLRMVAVIDQMQAGPEAERYSLDELIALAITMPTAWGRVTVWTTQEFAAHESRREGDLPGAVTRSASPPPSTNINSIPNSPTAGTPSSAASNGGCGPVPEHLAETTPLSTSCL